MHGHLVTVEVCVECGADEWVNLDGLAFDQDGLERLNTKAVKRRGTVEEHGVLSNDRLQHVPHLWATTLNHALGRLDVERVFAVNESLHHEWLEQFQGHELWQTTLVELERWANDDDGTARVVNALSEQVLTETSLLTLQHVRQRLERAVAWSSDWTATTAVVEQGIHCFLQHALFVVDDDLWSAKVKQSLQPVVAVDDSAVEVVQVRGSKTATVELHHGAKVWRDNRNGFQDHGPWVVDAAALLIAAVERSNDLQTLDRTVTTLSRQWLAAVIGFDLGTKNDFFLVQVNLVDEAENGLGAHATFEVVTKVDAQLAPQHLVFDDLAGVQ